MNPEIKTKFIEALRNGRYQQTKSALGKVNKDGTECYCATGLLCELAAQAGMVKKGIYGAGPNTYISYSGHGGFMPNKVANWAGLRARDCVLMRIKNDRGVSFDEIADWVENEL